MNSSYALGMSASFPVATSYIERSTAAPRLCLEPFAGFATKPRSRLSFEVISQKCFVTDQGR